MDDDASPEVLETMGVAANIHEDDTITPDSGKLIVGQGYTSNRQPSTDVEYMSAKPVGSCAGSEAMGISATDSFLRNGGEVHNSHEAWRCCS